MRRNGYDWQHPLGLKWCIFSPYPPTIPPPSPRTPSTSTRVLINLSQAGPTLSTIDGTPRTTPSSSDYNNRFTASISVLTVFIDVVHSTAAKEAIPTKCIQKGDGGMRHMETTLSSWCVFLSALPTIPLHSPSALLSISIYMLMNPSQAGPTHNRRASSSDSTRIVTASIAVATLNMRAIDPMECQGQYPSIPKSLHITHTLFVWQFRQHTQAMSRVKLRRPHHLLLRQCAVRAAQLLLHAYTHQDSRCLAVRRRRTHPPPARLGW